MLLELFMVLRGRCYRRKNSLALGKKMLLQSHCKGTVKLWNMKLGYSYSEQIEMNVRISSKSLCSLRERNELGSPIPSLKCLKLLS